MKQNIFQLPTGFQLHTYMKTNIDIKSKDTWGLSAASAATIQTVVQRIVVKNPMPSAIENGNEKYHVRGRCHQFRFKKLEFKNLVAI